MSVTEHKDGFPEGSGTALAVYGIYLSAIIFPLSFLIAPVVALIARQDAPEWLQGHFRFQLYTFLYGFIFSLIGILLAFVGGWIINILLVAWLAVRMIKGILLLKEGKPHPDPTGWMF